MSTLLTKLAADFTTQLAAAISIGGTTGTLLSQTDDDGNTLPDGVYVFTLDGSSSNKEYIRCTKTGTALTSIQSLSRQGALTSGVVRAHRIGASVSITDWAQLKYLTDLLSGATDLDSTDPLKYDGAATLTPGSNQLATVAYADALSIAGAAKATNSTFGIVKLSVAAVDSNIPIALGENDGRVLTQAENDAAAGAGATAPSSSNKFVTNSIIPAGVIMPYAGSSTPTDWLLCDGTAVNRTTYATLFAAIGTTYGTGDGSTTFNLPDLRGRMVIGSGAGSKVATFSSRSSNTITVTGLSNVSTNEFQTGQAITYNTSGSVITGLTNSTVYYISRVSNSSFQLSTTRANAIAGTVISLSSDGTGTQTFTLSLTTKTSGESGGEEGHSLVTAELPSHSHSLSESVWASGTEFGAITPGGSTYELKAVTASAAGSSTSHNNLSPYLAVNYIIKSI